jgi:hypothetical protein
MELVLGHRLLLFAATALAVELAAGRNAARLVRKTFGSPFKVY